MSRKLATNATFTVLAMLAAACTSSDAAGPAAPAPAAPFELPEASIADIQTALLARELTAVELVQRYLQRIEAYNGTCVNEPKGILGPVTPIANAGEINALTTLNLRPAAREAFGFDPRKARSMTDAVDDDPNMPAAYSPMLAFARTIAPASRKRFTKVASSGGRSFA